MITLLCFDQMSVGNIKNLFRGLEEKETFGIIYG